MTPSFRASDHEDGSYWEYDYDGRDRLIEAVRGNHATPTILATYDYTYDDADNMLTKKVPWYDDFEDGNFTGWSGNTANYSVSGGVLKNTLDTTVRDLYLSETDADHDLSFDYLRYSSTGRVDVFLRTIDGNNRLYLELNPGDIKLRQVDGGTLSTLATYTTTVAQNTWYKLRAVLDGTSVKIYWGANGAAFNEVISATTTKTTTARACYFRAQANSEHGFDNIQLIAGTRSTTETFTYNNANEQITHAKNGVITTMTYDDWGRLATRDDGTHDATYAYRYGSKLYNVSSDFPAEGNVTYETGGDGKRRSRVAGAEETWYNWASTMLIVSEENDSDGSSGTLVRTFAGRNLGQVDGASPSSSSWRFFTQDRLSTVHSAWNEDRSLFGAINYDPFGQVDSISGSATKMLRRFTGHMWDDLTDQYSTAYREYMPNQGRWSVRDPMGDVDGPNLYSYVRNSPTMSGDLLGLQSSFCEMMLVECNLAYAAHGPILGPLGGGASRCAQCYQECESRAALGDALPWPGRPGCMPPPPPPPPPPGSPLPRRDSPDLSWDDPSYPTPLGGVVGGVLACIAIAGLVLCPEPALSKTAAACLIGGLVIGGSGGG